MIPDNHYGHASSLRTFKNLLLIQFDQAKNGRVMALDTATGKEVWGQKRTVDISWSSPILIPYQDTFQLVLEATPLIIAYDPLTGKVLWQMKDVINGEIGSSAGFAQGIYFCANQESRLAAIDIAAKKIIWEYDDDLPDAPSLVAESNLVILPTSFGKTTCLDVKTGKVNWTYKTKYGSFSSPIIADGKVYLIDQKGNAVIFKEDAKLSVLGTPVLGEPCTSTPAFVNDRIFIRGQDNLFCIKKK